MEVATLQQFLPEGTCSVVGIREEGVLDHNRCSTASLQGLDEVLQKPWEESVETLTL